MSAVLGHRRKYPPRYSPGVTRRRLMRGNRGVLAWQNVVFCVAVTAVCAALIAAIWIVEQQQVAAQRARTLARAEAVVTGQANILAESVRQEMNLIDQSLDILRTAWNRDREQFDLKSWQQNMPAVTKVAKDIFISNDKGIIVQDILPQAVGQGVGSAYSNVGYGSLESVTKENRSGPHPGLVVGEKTTNGIARRYVMYVLRPLRTPPGWWIGASYRSQALIRLFAEGSLGPRGIAALIDTRVGGVQAVAGPAALRPDPNVANTAMYKWIEAQKANSGIWIGRTPMDQQVRIHAYRRIPYRGLIVLVGVDKADWMSAATVWARNAFVLAAAASAVVAASGGLILWWLWRLDANRRRRFALEQAAIQLNSAHSGLQIAELAAQTSVAQVRALMAAASDGIAVFDSEWRLAAWNSPYAASSGLPADFLRVGRPVDELFRQQAQLGLFGEQRDTEAEITRRLSELRDSKASESSFTQTAPDGRPLAIRGCCTPDGGMMLMVSGVSLPARRQLPSAEQPAKAAIAAPAEQEVKAPTAEEPPVEW